MAGREPAPACSSLHPHWNVPIKSTESHWPRQQCRIPSQPVALLLALTPVSDVSALKDFSVCRGSDKGQFWRQVLRSEGPVPGLHLLPLWEGLLHPSAAQAAAVKLKNKVFQGFLNALLFFSARFCKVGWIPQEWFPGVSWAKHHLFQIRYVSLLGSWIFFLVFKHLQRL